MTKNVKITEPRDGAMQAVRGSTALATATKLGRGCGWKVRTNIVGFKPFRSNQFTSGRDEFTNVKWVPNKYQARRELNALAKGWNEFREID